MTIAVSPALVLVGEYLGSVYRPDREYVDGTLEERNVGEIDHADVQYALLLALAPLWECHGLRARPELRVQITPTRFRVPDICVLPKGWKRTRIVNIAPLLCIEILSPRDTIRDTRRKAEEYLSIGVAEVWIFDPQTRTAYLLTLAGMRELRQGALTLEGTAVAVEVSRIFSTLDE